MKEWLAQLPGSVQAITLVVSAILYAAGINMYKCHWAFLFVTTVGVIGTCTIINIHIDVAIAATTDQFALFVLSLLPVLVFLVLMLPAFRWAETIKRGGKISLF